jgi:hypothetical protein
LYDDTDDLHRRNRAWLSDRDHLRICIAPSEAIAALSLDPDARE